MTVVSNASEVPASPSIAPKPTFSVVSHAKDGNVKSETRLPSTRNIVTQVKSARIVAPCVFGRSLLWNGKFIMVDFVGFHNP